MGKRHKSVCTHRLNVDSRPRGPKSPVCVGWMDGPKVPEAVVLALGWTFVRRWRCDVPVRPAPESMIYDGEDVLSLFIGNDEKNLRETSS